MADSTTFKKEPALNWVLWWLVGRDELARQVEQYATLPFLRSARGGAALCLFLSAALTTILVAFDQLAPAGLVGAIIAVALAVFVYMGHRWAHLAAMAFWTLEKFSFLLPDIETRASPVTQVGWWCIFMHAFYLSYRVELERRKANPAFT